MSTELRMSDLDTKLQRALHRRRENGVVDIKCHVDVTATTDPRDFKRALLNVFEQDAAGTVARTRVGKFKSFDDLCRQIG